MHKFKFVMSCLKMIFFLMNAKALRKISLLFVIKLQTKDFFVSDNLSAFFLNRDDISHGKQEFEGCKTSY